MIICIMKAKRNTALKFEVREKSMLNKSENATLQLCIFYEKVLDKKYLLKLNNVSDILILRCLYTEQK